ncbi:MAG: DUF4128 domain-containing protein [Myxococcota bacterium]
MASDAETKIAEALYRHLAALVLVPALKIAWTNMDFRGAAKVGHLRVSLIRATAEGATIPFDGHIRHSGIFQVDVMWPQGAGPIGALRRADAIREHFARGTRLVEDDVCVQINRPPSVGPSLQNPPYLQVPVSVRYEAFIQGV